MIDKFCFLCSLSTVLMLTPILSCHMDVGPETAADNPEASDNPDASDNQNTLNGEEENLPTNLESELTNDSGSASEESHSDSLLISEKDASSTTNPTSTKENDKQKNSEGNTIRTEGYTSIAPPLGEPLPEVTARKWEYIDVEGTIARDGSVAGFYYKFSDTSDNLMIYLAGGGACQDAFFCNNNPPNKDFSLTAESVLAGATNLLGPNLVPQDPNLPMWQSGIFMDNPSNPVADWNMVFIPYVSGDVYAGNRGNGTVPGYTAPQPLQFFGYNNMTKFLSRIVATFSDAETVLLAGSSAGGIGALLNVGQVADGFIDNSTSGSGVQIVLINDAGAVFDDSYLGVCLQKKWRQIWNLNDTLPPDCAGCFNPDGGGLVAGYLEYIFAKYPNMRGGLVDSTEDEIMKLFFSDELNNCAIENFPPIAFLGYTAGHYAQGLIDLRENHLDKERMSTYFWPGALHQNLFNPGMVDRFYQTNGLEMTIAEWLTRILDEEVLHLGD